ncbi:MAG: hypothetical protein PWP27_625 [Clostridiales bacterium]|nr:hypothetical protein [Clostridiales bacterium]
MTKKNLILITANYPFGKGEEFLETEINYLKDNFKNIIIISENDRHLRTRKIPSGIKVYRFSENMIQLEIFKCISLTFIKDFLMEIKDILFTYHLKLNIAILRELLSMMVKGLSIKRYIDDIIQENKILNNNDELFLYTYWFNAATYAIIQYKRQNESVKVFSRTHRYDLYFERNCLHYLPLRKQIIKKLDVLFFISDHGKEYFKKKLLLNTENKLKVSKLGIRNDLKVSKPSNDNILRIISCSFAVDVKRIDLIIKAIAQIKNYDVYWTHIGDGPKLKELKELANALLSNKSNISYEFLGYLENKEIYNYYTNRMIDVFINVSASEGIPVSIMEACSFSIPIIATSVGGVSEIVNDNNGVLLSPNPSINEITEAINKIKFSSQSDIQRYRENAYQTWSKWYNADVNYNKFINSIFKLK